MPCDTANDPVQADHVRLEIFSFFLFIWKYFQARASAGSSVGFSVVSVPLSPAKLPTLLSVVEEEEEEEEVEVAGVPQATQTWAVSVWMLLPGLLTISPPSLTVRGEEARWSRCSLSRSRTLSTPSQDQPGPGLV